MGEVAGFGALASALLEIVGGLLIASFGAYDLFLSGKPERPFLSLVLLLAGVGGAVWQGRKKLLPALGASGLRLNKRHVLIGGGLALAVFVIWVYSGPSGPVGQRGAAPAPSGPVVMTTVNRLHWIALFLIAATVLSLGRLLGLQSDPATLAGRRLANGLATLAVFAFVWKSLADDFGSPGSPLYFFIECFRLIAVNPGVYVPLVALPVVAAISAARAFVGFFGPFPPGQRHMGGAIVTLAICAAAWVFGLFVPPSWGWGEVGETINFALRAFYLFGIVGEAVWVVILTRGSGAGPEIDSNTQRRNRRMAAGRGDERFLALGRRMGP